MNFIFLKFSPLLIIVFILFIYLFKRQEKQYFLWIKKIWFLNRSRTNTLAGFVYFLSFFFLAISFLDLRGKEEIIKTSIPDQKTIVVIDASASMLTEDVRPNRFKKSLLLAKHFVKNAVGHQIAVILFSDTHRKLVPFTDDIDLLTGRIDALAETDIRYGGSNISLAIKESLQYFRNSTTKLEDVKGNILVFTDSEENGDGIKVEIPTGINLGIVGVGTNKGGTIPLRDRRGNFRGYKKYNGKEVISRLDEKSLKKMGSNVKNYRYWIALSYSVPTLEIIQFFRKIHKSSLAKGDVRVRPVKASFLLIPFILFFILSISLKRFKTFRLSVFILFLFTNTQVPDAVAKDIDPKVSSEIQEKMSILKSGDAKKEEKWKLAELYLKTGDAKSALTIFDENVGHLKNISAGTLLNYGTALLMDGKIKKGSLIFLELKKDLEKNKSKEAKKMIEVMARNTLLALKKNDQKKKDDQKKKKEDEKKKQDKKKGDDKKKSEKNKKGDQKNKKDGKEKDPKNKKDEQKKKKGKEGEKEKQKTGDPKSSEEKEKKEQKEKKSQKNDEKEDDKKKKGQSLEEKEAEIKKKRKMTKLPAILKKILNEDRNLQKKKQKTSVQGGRRKKKDW